MLKNLAVSRKSIIFAASNLNNRRIMNKKVNVIYSDIYDEKDYDEGFKEYCEDNGLNEEKTDIYDYIHDSLRDWLECEHVNLDKPCGTIIAIANLGLWNGRRSGYGIIRVGKVNGIFSISGHYDNVTFYCDRYNVKAELYHHDGVNYIEFREVKENVNPQPLLDRLFKQEEVTRELIRS